MDVTRLEGTWRNMAWFARMDHQSQEMLCAATVALGWGLNAFYLPQLSYSYYIHFGYKIIKPVYCNSTLQKCRLVSSKI